MTKEEFLSSNYLVRKFYIYNGLGFNIKDLSIKHKRTQSAIIQALQGKIPSLLDKIVQSKYMKFDEEII